MKYKRIKNIELEKVQTNCVGSFFYLKNDLSMTIIIYLF